MSKREDFDKPETPEERTARLKARKEREAARKAEQEVALAKFNADVDAIRPKIMKRLCPTCREVGSYAGMVRGRHDLYIVSFRCSINHHWSVTVGVLEAHALRFIGMDDKPRPIGLPPLVPDPEPLPFAEGTPAGQSAPDPEPLVPDEAPEPDSDPEPLVPDEAPAAKPVLTSGPVCGSCAEPVGAKYYAGVPTSAGKLDLCMKCWETWPSRR